MTEKEILAIAIAAEEEDGRIYGEFADALRDEYPSTAQMFEEMRAEEAIHRDRLFEMFRQRFGERIPLLRDVVRLVTLAIIPKSRGACRERANPHAVDATLGDFDAGQKSRYGTTNWSRYYLPPIDPESGATRK